jgi:hypothetical protein
VPEHSDAKLFKILLRQARQDPFVYLVLAECRLIFSGPRLRSQTTTSIGAPLSRVAVHHGPCPGWMQPDIQLHVSFIVSLHHGLEEERPMTVEEKRRGFQRRSGKDRRSGVDTRSEEEKRRIGERRSGVDRRSASDRRSSTDSHPPKRS